MFTFEKVIILERINFKEKQIFSRFVFFILFKSNSILA